VFNKLCQFFLWIHAISGVSRNSIPPITPIPDNSNLVSSYRSRELCTYQFKARKRGVGGRAWDGNLIHIVGPGVGPSTDHTFPGRGFLHLSSPNVGIFERWLEWKRLRPKLLFPLEIIMDIHESENQRKVSEFDCFISIFSIKLKCFFFIWMFLGIAVSK